MSIANKLSYLGETKEEIREGLNKLGGNISKSDTFRSYADAIEEIYDSMPKVEESDVENATLEGTIKGGLTIDPKGNTSQYSTTGKNLANVNVITSNNFTISEDGKEIKLKVATSGNGNTDSGKKLSKLCPTLQIGETYYLYFTRNLGTTYNNLIYLSSSGTSWYNGTPQTITQQMLDSYVYFYANRYQDGETAQCILTDFRIVRTENDTWEPYTNGASPNPDYPQVIHTITGDNEIVVCGKNIFNVGVKSDYTGEGSTFFNVEGNTLVNRITSGAANYMIKNQKFYINNFYFSTVYDKNSNIGRLLVRAFDENDNIITSSVSGWTYNAYYQAYFKDSTGSSFSLQSASYIKVGVVWMGTTGEDGTYSNIFLTSSSDTTYEPYQSQTYPIYLGVENLYNGTYSSTTEKLGVVATRQDDGSYSLSGTCSSPTPGANADFVLGNCTLEAGTYVISGYPNKTGIRLRYRPTAGDWTGATDVGETGLVITLNQQSTIDLVISVSNGTNTNGTIVYPQIELGTKKNSFTPYGTTPIELNAIGNYKDGFARNTGKNLFNPSTALIKTVGNFASSNLLEATDNTSISINNNNTLSGTTDNYVVVVSPHTFIKDKTINNLGFIGSRWVIVYNNLGVPIYVSDNSRQYTPTDNFDGYIGIGININNNVANQRLFFSYNANDNFEPYGTGQWCKYNAIGKVVLNGSEDGWSKFNEISDCYKNNAIYKSLIKKPSNNSTPIDGLTDYLQVKAWYRAVTGVYQTKDGFSVDMGGDLYIGSINMNLLEDTLTAFQNYLSLHNLITYIVLATPYLSLIEDTTLISQLDNIQNAMSYEGQTNVLQVNNDLPFKLDLKAILDWRNNE